ncbi:hypothetical protein M422DRAFT_250243 [Sphaerobolus stellatus SS14]|uniref:Uncharacterized protein n=1 Tax=Sphaerobolus stellatus (strain SS14) TaxID=990650 RepID=A0A0C9VGP2_SPHS4|nr:hypothetical protein M422DRAFT_250243 [Sphaerobolus stellatus SS14]
MTSIAVRHCGNEQRRLNFGVRQGRARSLYQVTRPFFENEVHAVLTCNAHELIVVARTHFLSQLPSLGAAVPIHPPPGHSQLDFFRALLGWPQVLPSLAQLVHVVLSEYGQYPIYIHQ